MKIWHISDTHSYHYLLDIPEGVDMVIHSGDATNYKDIYKNEVELKDFLYWFERVPIPIKIFVAGNHDSAIEKNLFDVKKQMKDSGIIYLENDFVEIEGIKIWGSPHTPQFGDWCFMKNRAKLDRVWQQIPEDTDVIIVHGPPKGVLDFSHKRDRSIEMCGCSALKKRIDKIKPKLVLFGHIHNNRGIINSGVMSPGESNIVYSNGSVVTDGEFGWLTSNGNIIEI